MNANKNIAGRTKKKSAHNSEDDGNSIPLSIGIYHYLFHILHGDNFKFQKNNSLRRIYYYRGNVYLSSPVGKKGKKKFL